MVTRHIVRRYRLRHRVFCHSPDMNAFRVREGVSLPRFC